MHNGQVSGIAWCLDFQCTEYRFTRFMNETSGAIDQTSDPTGIRAAIREIDQKPWREVETENMIEPSIIVSL